MILKSIPTYIIIILMMVFTTCSRQNSLRQYGVKGKVKSFFQHSYNPVKRGGEWTTGSIAKNYLQNKTSFDEEGRMISIEYYNYQNVFVSKVIPHYENGVITKEVHYKSNGDTLSISYINHISKNEREFKYYNTEGDLMNSGTTYLKKNKIVKQIFNTFQNEKLENQLTITVEYHKGNMLKQKQRDINGNIIYDYNFEYLKYDNRKNWIKVLSYKNGKPEYVVIREIEYY